MALTSRDGQYQTLCRQPAWVGIFCEYDGCHGRAVEYWRRIREERRILLTSDYVLDETYTLLRRSRNGLKMAVAFHDLIESSRVIEIVSVDEALCEAAWRTFVQYDDKVLSFTDCTSFALMRQRGLVEVFTFDADADPRQRRPPAPPLPLSVCR